MGPVVLEQWVVIAGEHLLGRPRVHYSNSALHRSIVSLRLVCGVTGVVIEISAGTIGYLYQPAKPPTSAASRISGGRRPYASTMHLSRFQSRSAMPLREGAHASWLPAGPIIASTLQQRAHSARWETGSDRPKDRLACLMPAPSYLLLSGSWAGDPG
ncbi:hypothetical protein VTN96DRAFT_6886 [Rasamsonia emersonii]